ncbi:MAG: FAD-dependent oxidoreductase [Firmicutes bacterium]|nr:FAD-dependent oxidoreductase [Bacillota bacterium]
MKIRVLGAGYAGVRAALDLARRFRGRRDVRISLINQDGYHQLVTELHRPAAGSVTGRALAIPLRDIFAGTGVELIRGTVTDIRWTAHQFVLDRERVFRYDRLVVALGSEPEYFSIPGMAEHSLTIRSLNSAGVIRRHIASMFREAAGLPSVRDRRPYLTVVVAGGGFTGVEFAGELADRVRGLARRTGAPAREVRIITVEAAPDILPGFDDPLVEAAVDTLVRKGVSLMMGVPIAAVERGAVVLQDGRGSRPGPSSGRGECGQTGWWNGASPRGPGGGRWSTSICSPWTARMYTLSATRRWRSIPGQDSRWLPPRSMRSARAGLRHITSGPPRPDGRCGPTREQVSVSWPP